MIAFALVVSGCGSGADHDHLAAARKRLKPARCGGAPSVAAVASVNTDPHQSYLGDWILVSVCHLDVLLKNADAAQSPVTLFVEGRDSLNEPVGVDLESGVLTFVLDRHENNRELWRPFLYDPLFDPEVSVRISAGVRGDRPLPRTPGANLTVRIRKLYVDWTTWLWFGGLLALTAGVFYCARHTDMLREGPPVNGARRPYGLGRAQMAWWFFLIAISYSFIWMVTGDRDTITTSLLGLMGISSATAIAAAIIPSSRSEPRTSQGWWRDLVSDDQGAVALDRLQIVVWTAILSGIFLTSVVWEVTMPEFNATMLALMGISSGTYIGFKLPQKGE